MAYTLTRSVISKRIIDILIGFIRGQLSRNRLYQTTDVSDRFSLEQVQIPCVIIKGVSNSQKRVHFDDFIEDYDSRVQLIPISADSNLFGSNISQVNLPDNVNYDPRWPWDNTIGLSSGTDINKTVFTSGTVTNTGTSTGIIVTVPGPNTFDPTSISFADEIEGAYSPSLITGTNTYNLALALNAAQDQFYLMVSGTDIPITASLAVEPNQLIIDGSGIAPGLSGTRIYMGDVLFAGDQYQINTYPNKVPTYSIYGGIYNANMSFECYARTTIEAEELGDLVESILVERKLDLYDRFGITSTAWGQGGGSEREYVNDHIFQSTVTSEMMKEWHEYRSIQTITGASGIGIPYGVWSGNYLAPGVYSYENIGYPNVPYYFSSYIKVSGVPIGLPASYSGITGNTVTSFGVY
jgi:hypothetical protein